jgi:hypothetical protein
VADTDEGAVPTGDGGTPVGGTHDTGPHDAGPHDAGTPDSGPTPLSDADVHDAQGGVTTPLSDADIRDALPEDLDAAGYVGPYMFPNNNRRRVPAVLYFVIAAILVIVWLLRRDLDPVLINVGWLWAAGALAAMGAYSFVAGWNLDVDERDALVAAVREVGFPVGHASAQLGWRGLLSRPTWRILLYSAEDPPSKRGLMLIDGVDGRVIEGFVEDNPEDWAALTGA